MPQHETSQTTGSAVPQYPHRIAVIVLTATLSTVSLPVFAVGQAAPQALKTGRLRKQKRQGSSRPAARRPAAPRPLSASPQSRLRASKAAPDVLQTLRPHRNASFAQTPSLRTPGRTCNLRPDEASIVVIPPPGAKSSTKHLPWGKTMTASHQGTKFLVADRCVVEASQGTKLVFKKNDRPCGRVLLLAGTIEIWPACPMEVAGNENTSIVLDPSIARLVSKGLEIGTIGRRPGWPWALPRMQIPNSLNLDAILPSSSGTATGLTIESKGSVSSVGGGSMCLDTAGGSAAAGSVQQGPNVIQKPAPKARVIVQVEMPR